jgi:hypothetical protein
MRCGTASTPLEEGLHACQHRHMNLLEILGEQETLVDR